jgi:hypothetical protein
VSQVWAELLRSLVDAIVLPIRIDYYPILLRQGLNELNNRTDYKDIFVSANITSYLGIKRIKE